MPYPLPPGTVSMHVRFVGNSVEEHAMNPAEPDKQSGCQGIIDGASRWSQALLCRPPSAVCPVHSWVHLYRTHRPPPANSCITT